MLKRLIHNNWRWGYVFILLLVACNNKEKSPREMNGKTYLRTADSVYFISFTIDSVIKMEYEPEERN